MIRRVAFAAAIATAFFFSGSAKPAQAQLGVTVVGVGEFDTEDTYLVLGGVSVSPRGEGWSWIAGVSAYWSAMNRNKRGIALDLKQAAGRQIVLDLVAAADVVVQNFRPGAIDRLGLGWEALSAVNPQLVMCSVSARNEANPGSRSPVRVLITSPAAGVNPILVSTLLPPCTAAMLAPLPRWARITRRLAASVPASRASSSMR